jgi:mRNA-degrading endonuclease RelE of RelBE toxin-antitoxin system
VKKRKHRVELASRAERDIRKLERADQLRVRDALAALAAGGDQLDVKPLKGRAPWRRLRTGDLRIIFRPLAGEEALAGDGWLVGRIVDRRELERAIRNL